MKTAEGHLVQGHLCPALRVGTKNEWLAQSYQQYSSQEIFQRESSKLFDSRLMVWFACSPWSRGRHWGSLLSHLDFLPSRLLSAPLLLCSGRSCA